MYSAQFVRKLAIIQANVVQLKVLRYREIVALYYTVADQHAGTIDHIDIINNEIITAINGHRGVVYSRLLAEVRSDILGLNIANNKVLTVFDVD